VLKWSQSGRCLGQSLAESAQRAASMEALTGQSIDKVVVDFEKLAENPVKALKALNDQYNLISPTEAAEIKRLQDEGNIAEAAARAIHDVAQAEQQRTAQLAQGEGLIGRFVNSWKSGFSNMKAAVMNWGAPETLQQQLNATNQQLNEFIEHAQDRFTQVNGKVQFDPTGASPTYVRQVNALLAQRESLMQQLTAEQQKQQQLASQTAKNKDGVDGALGTDTTDLETQLRQQEADQQVSYDKRLTFEQNYWQNVLMSSKEGSAEYVEAWQRVQSIQEQVDEARTTEVKREQEAQTEAQRKAAEAQRQANAQAMNELEEERAATQDNTDARIQADAAILAGATKLYGAMSSQQREALRQMAADDAAYSAQWVKDQEDQLATNIKADEDKIAEHRRSTQQELADGEITAKQALATEEDQNKKALADYQAYIAAKEALDVGNLHVLQKDAQDWAAFQTKINSQITADQQATTREIQQQWQQTFRPITQAFDQSITGMIQGTKTISQTWKSMLADLLMSEIRSGVQRLARWTATELAKTAATNAGNASRIASNEAADRTGMAQEGAMSEKEIMNSAYTAGAKAYQAVVGIPIVGPVLAPVAAATAFAGVMAFDNISSAAGGWERVPYDDAPALLHRNEMVLPSTLADRVRGMTEPAMASGGNQNIHIHANDARSFGQLLQRDPHMFAKAARKAIRTQRNRP